MVTALLTGTENAVSVSFLLVFFASDVGTSWMNYVIVCAVAMTALIRRPEDFVQTTSTAKALGG